MTTRPDPTCKGLMKWLRLNLGRSALAALTGTDSKALCAAVHILELYNYGGDDSTLEAFRLVVLKMVHPELAYHAIAYLMDWHNRGEVWAAAGLPPLERVSRCEGER